MVSLQFWRRKADEPIATVLKQLQSQINSHEIRASSLRQKQRSITGQIAIYSVLIYLAYLVYYALGKNYELEGQTVLAWAFKFGVIVVFPASVFGLRRGVRWWYTRRIEREVREKDAVKRRLQEKIEELKEKSDYYNTQQLLERYDSKNQPKHPTNERLREPVPHQSHQPHLHHKRSSDNLRRQASIEGLRQRNVANPPLLPPMPQRTFPPPPQNVPQFHPSAFSPPSSPTLAPLRESKTVLDRLLDLLVGEDENGPDNRYALICRHCRAHNGLAPPGERPDQVGYLCGRCGGWNGPDLNKVSGPDKEVDTSLSMSTLEAKVEDRTGEIPAPGPEFNEIGKKEHMEAPQE